MHSLKMRSASAGFPQLAVRQVLLEARDRVLLAHASEQLLGHVARTESSESSCPPMAEGLRLDQGRSAALARALRPPRPWPCAPRADRLPSTESCTACRRPCFDRVALRKRFLLLRPGQERRSRSGTTLTGAFHTAAKFIPLLEAQRRRLSRASLPKLSSAHASGHAPAIAALFA